MLAQSFTGFIHQLNIDDLLGPSSLSVRLASSARLSLLEVGMILERAFGA
jgi:hypothetical protein